MSDSPKALEIRHDERNQAFMVVVDGQTCVVDYQLRDHVMTITHTGVPQAVGGRGIAGLLTRFAVDTAKEKGWKVIPACSYAERWFERNKDYAPLLA
jgi:predicted GNAT family acetyltransferase